MLQKIRRLREMDRTDNVNVYRYLSEIKYVQATTEVWSVTNGHYWSLKFYKW